MCASWRASQQAPDIRPAGAALEAAAAPDSSLQRTPGTRQHAAACVGHSAAHMGARSPGAAPGGRQAAPAQPPQLLQGPGTCQLPGTARQLPAAALQGHSPLRTPPPAAAAGAERRGLRPAHPRHMLRQQPRHRGLLPQVLLKQQEQEFRFEAERTPQAGAGRPPAVPARLAGCPGTARSLTERPAGQHSAAHHPPVPAAATLRMNA